MPASYSLAQIVEVERYACCYRAPDAYPQYSFDGINFWRHPAVFKRELVVATQTPDDGWSHRERCIAGSVG